MAGYFSGRRTMVTGAAGFLGSHLTRRLLSEGALVTGLDNFSGSRPDTTRSPEPEGAREISVDLRSSSGVEGVIEAVRPEIVFHLAALANPRTCEQNFPLAFDVNVVGTQNVLQFSPMDARVVFMSSASVYGVPERLPLAESHPRNGSDPYSVTKILGEELVASYVQNYQRNIVIVRNFNTFGVGQTGDYIVPQLIRQALTDHQIELWDARTVRDLMYVDDTIDALLTVASSEERSVVNVGTGRGTVVGDLARIIGERVGGSVPVVDLKKKLLSSPALVSDSSRLRALGWTEKVSFEEGLDRTIAWTRRLLADFAT
jgi:nucleoside-diphosphate-sugar epimerase